VLGKVALTTYKTEYDSPPPRSPRPNSPLCNNLDNSHRVDLTLVKSAHVHFSHPFFVIGLPANVIPAPPPSPASPRLIPRV